MNNTKYVIPIEFIFVPKFDKNRENNDKFATISASTDFIYHSGLRNREDIDKIRTAFNLIRRNGIHEKIATPLIAFPESLRVVYSLENRPDQPSVDISPINDEIIYSCLASINKKTYPKFSILEARQDGINLDYGFVDLTLRFTPTDKRYLLDCNGGSPKGVED